MKKLATKFRVMLLMGIINVASFATTNSDMSWEEPTTGIKDSITGPVAQAVGLIAITVAALTWAYSDGGNMMGKAIKMVIALAIVGGSGVLISNVFDIGGGVSF